MSRLAIKRVSHPLFSSQNGPLSLESGQKQMRLHTPAQASSPANGCRGEVLLTNPSLHWQNLLSFYPRVFGMVDRHILLEKPVIHSS